MVCYGSQMCDEFGSQLSDQFAKPGARARVLEDSKALVYLSSHKSPTVGARAV
jgi:hypothetical protein